MEGERECNMKTLNWNSKRKEDVWGGKARRMVSNATTKREQCGYINHVDVNIEHRPGRLWVRCDEDRQALTSDVIRLEERWRTVPAKCITTATPSMLQVIDDGHERHRYLRPRERERVRNWLPPGTSN